MTWIGVISMWKAKPSDRAARGYQEAFLDAQEEDLLRSAIVNRICGKHEKLYIQPFLLTILFSPINYAPP